MPITPAELAARITPALVDQLELHKPEIIAHAGGFIARHGVATAWPRLMAEMPTLAEVACGAVLDEFGAMTIADIVDALTKHKQSRGLR